MQTNKTKPKERRFNFARSKDIIFKSILILSLFFISIFETTNDIKFDVNERLQDFDYGSPNMAANGIDELVFSDDFSDLNYDGWTVKEGNWTVDNGYLRSRGWVQPDPVYGVVGYTAEILKDLGSPLPFNNLSLDFDYRYETPFFNGTRGQEFTIRFYINDSSYFSLMIFEDGAYGGRGNLRLYYVEGAVNDELADSLFTPDDQWHPVNITIIDNIITVLYDGLTQIDQVLVPGFENRTFSAVSVYLSGWDEVFDMENYRNIDNIFLKKAGTNSQKPEQPEESENPQDPSNPESEEENQFKIPIIIVAAASSIIAIISVFFKNRKKKLKLKKVPVPEENLEIDDFFDFDV